MPNVAVEAGGGDKKKKKHHSVSTTHTVHTADPITSLLYSSKPSAPQPTYSAPPRPQPVIKAPPPIRPVTPSYSVYKSAWGGSAFPKQTKMLSRVLPALRSKLGDEQEFNSILAQLMNDRYDTFEDRLNDKFTHQRNVYQRKLDSALDAQREGLDYQVPEMPDLPKIPRGQGVPSLIDTFADSLKPGMSSEEKDAYSKFYEYELTRLLDYKKDIRGQRNSLTGYYENYLTDSQGDTMRERHDRQSKGKGAEGNGSDGAVGKRNGIFDSLFGKPGYYDQVFGGIPESTQAPERAGFFSSPSAPFTHTIDAIHSVNKKIWGEVDDPLQWTVDKLSRPIFGVNNAGKAYYNSGGSDDGFSWDDAIFGGLAGKSILEPLGNLTGGDVKDIGKGFWEGFSGKDKTLFSQVIADNAKRDKAGNYLDNKWYQNIAGLAGDIGLDPLNWVGIGVVTKPINAVRDAQKSEELLKVARKTAKLASKGHEEIYSGVFNIATKQHVPGIGPMERPLKVKNVYDLLGGNVKAANAGDKVRSLAQTNYNVQRLIHRLDSMDFTPGTEVSDSIASVGRVLREQRDAILKDFEGASVVEALQRDLKIKVAKGEEPASAMEEFDQLLTSSYLESKLIDANMYYKYLNDVAEAPVHKGGFNTGHTMEYVDEANTSKKVVDTPTNIMGRKENVAVEKGGTKARATKRKSQAWENVGKSYENKKMLWENESDPVKKQQMKKVLDDFKAKIDKTLAEAPGGPLSELMPELVNDYRMTPEQVDRLFTEAYRAAYDNPTFRKLTSTSKGIYKQVRYGTNEAVRQSARTRWNFVNRQKNRILGDVAVKILRAHLESGSALLEKGGTVYRNPERVKEIRAEIAKMDKEFGVPQMGADSFDKWGDDVARTKRRDLQEELDSLKGYGEAGIKRSLTENIPERFLTLNRETGELVFDMKKLKSHIRVDLRTGKAGDVNPFYGTFRILPTLMEKDPATYHWLSDVRQVLQERYEPVFDELYKPVRESKREMRESGQNISKADHIEWKRQTEKAAKAAEQQAFDSIGRDIAFGRLHTIEFSDAIPVKHLTSDTPVEQLLDALKFRYDAKTADLKMQKYTAMRTHQDDEVNRINEQLEGLKEKWLADQTRQKEILDEAKKGRIIMAKRLKEEALLTAAQLAVSPLRKNLSLRLIGKDLAIPHTEMMFDAVDKMSGLPLIKQTRQAYGNCFKPPSAHFKDNEEMQLALARFNGQTPIIIEHHINKLARTLGQVPEHERVRMWDDIMKGSGATKGEVPVQDAINDAFDELMPFFHGYDMGPAGRLSIADINRYLPPEYRLNTTYVNRNGVDTVQKLAAAIRTNKAVNTADRNALRDPYRVSWVMRIGVEQAAARKALEHTINSTFGVKDLKIVQGVDDSVGEIMQEFTKLGWQRVPALNNQHLFPPEIVPDIHRMLNMLEPRNVDAIGRLFDRASGYWKTMTTIYNPGYWTRNGIGEVMSGWLGGVNDARWYERSFNGVIKYARGDGQELDALKKQFSMLNYIPSESVPGARKVSELADGTPITAEQAWVLYNDQGLKSGFVNTEFDAQYSRLGDVLRSNVGATQTAANMHRGLRSAGEWYEDGLRIAHFLHAMNKSGAKDLTKAAEYAAKEVRKYHFDYTDFTKFEKTVMLRAFPFYKWTRKALPLMTTMLFTKPGKMTAYSKTMNTLQNSLTTHDISEDTNGFAPNYSDIVPGWIQDMWAYQIAGNEVTGGGRTTYMNLNTPQLESMKAMNSPGPTAYGLLNPLIKTPIEAGQIAVGGGDKPSVLKSLFDKADFGANEPLNLPLQANNDESKQSGGDATLTALMRDTPQTNFLTKFGLTDGKDGQDEPAKQEWFNILTGLGTYFNDDQRRQGAIYDH